MAEIAGIDENFSTLPKSKVKKRRKRRKHTPKYRRHIYLTDDCIEDVEEKATAVTGGNFSLMVQILVSIGLKHFSKQKMQSLRF